MISRNHQIEEGQSGRLKLCLDLRTHQSSSKRKKNGSVKLFSKISTSVGSISTKTLKSSRPLMIPNRNIKIEFW